jgi:hypothetical protein
MAELYEFSVSQVIVLTHFFSMFIRIMRWGELSGKHLQIVHVQESLTSIVLVCLAKVMPIPSTDSCEYPKDLQDI